ncbi:P-loop containing nucleoside triphosphate hydrolases superfamily protein [Perilla frutescens var. hirtella]|uniref:P-loop containing nucleoside triphosphate hydrolases superfamily protein n=1 Tax=Perilla frutescens var. hirtella TaxID=608512 RepID=A0AAD4IQ33_PERFH|nr:P-loop containing nucleoside triphosphate hydrolases superfamily protein [Perilla frutescens var. hirtella]
MRRGRGGMRGRGRYNGAPHKNERSATKIKDKAIPRMSPRGETFKKELLSKIVPWEEITVSLSNFPYYIDQHPKDLLMECVASYLKQTKLRNFLGRLKSSSERILLRSILGTELYLERLVSALARELQVPFLKFARELELEVPSMSLRLDDDDDDCDNDYYHEELVSAYERDDEFPKFKRGDRVIYYNEEATISVDGLNNRTFSYDQRGEVYEVDGDRVAVVFNISGLKTKEAEKDVKSTETTQQALVTWVNVRQLIRDDNARTHDCYIAMEALYEVLASQQPLIVYFPDSHFGLSDSKHHVHEEFLKKMRKIFNQLPEGVVMICADHWEATSKEMNNFPQSLRNYVGCLESPRRYHELKDICKLFTNVVCINPPTDQYLLNEFIKQIEEDRFTRISEGNLNIMHKFLKDRNLSCINLEHENFEDVILTRQRVEKIVGWASNHYLSSCDLSCVNQENLHIPLESIKLALLRLKEEEPQSKNHSYYHEDLASGYHEQCLDSAVVHSEDIGLKLDDVGALESVKKVLYETAILPMRRPELFSHGNLLKPCKGILLYGPPGTGKAFLAKALATESGADFINVKTATLTAKQQGESSEKLTRALFSYARKLAPVIMFVDEDESLLGARGHNKYDTIRLNEFLAAWDGLNWKESERILVIGATNRPFDLDEAVIRRMPRRIYVGLPDVETRLKILKILLSKENLESGFSFEQLAEATQGYSGSDLKKLCVAAAYRPIEEFLQQESKVRPSVEYDASSIMKIREWNEQYGEGETQTRHI